MRYSVSPFYRLTLRTVEVPCLIKGLDLPCWVVTANINFYGYGRIKINGREFGAHRFAYLEMRGEIPEGLELDHLCRVRACWNPWHVEPVTPAINSERGLTGMKSGRKLPILPVQRRVEIVRKES